MKAMTAYSIKADSSLALRAFSSKRAAMRFGNGQHIFSNVDELANSRITSEDARRVYHAVTGKLTNISERQLLSEMLFNAISAAKLPAADKEIEMVIACQQPEQVVQQTKSVEKSTKVEKAEQVETKTISKKEKVMTEQVSESNEGKKKFARSPKSNTTNPLEAYGVHSESNRATVLLRLEKKIGQQISLEELVIAVYGTNEKRNVSSFAMVMKGLLAIQAANDLAIEIRKEKIQGKGISYGLYIK